MLLLVQGANNELLIQAKSLGDHEIDVLTDEKPEESDQLSLGIVNYVARSLESVVLGEATEEGDFTGDPYIQTRQSKSVLSMPILNQGKLVTAVPSGLRPSSPLWPRRLAPAKPSVNAAFVVTKAQDAPS
ncbi:MAG: hypothetical protein GY924_25245 [Planctomycetaceae bacterium]|nr:hypothetical protein [Planctomycetaceae bacterium]